MDENALLFKIVKINEVLMKYFQEINLKYSGMEIFSFDLIYLCFREIIHLGQNDKQVNQKAQEKKRKSQITQPCRVLLSRQAETQQSRDRNHQPQRDTQQRGASCPHVHARLARTDSPRPACFHSPCGPCPCSSLLLACATCPRLSTFPCSRSH